MYSGWAKAHPAHPLMASLQMVCIYLFSIIEIVAHDFKNLTLSLILKKVSKAFYKQQLQSFINFFIFFASTLLVVNWRFL